MQKRSNYLRIEICGGIGVGKSTFASRLAARIPTSELICEDFRANPLWAAYYEAPHRFVREKNISFLAQHFAEIKHGKSDIVITDFSTLQDLAYAQLTGDPEHQRVMQDVHYHLEKQVGPPTVVVQLVASVERQLTQIALRGRAEESLLNSQALRNLNAALTRVLSRLVEPKKLRVIDISSIDLRENTSILDQISNLI